MPKRKTAEIVLTDLKDPDGWWQLADALGLSEEKRKEYFSFGEYASVRLVVGEDLRIVGGEILSLR